MAISNTLVKKTANSKVSTFLTGTGEITLSNEIVRNYLTNGNGHVSDQECMMFIALCKGQKLNPFIREAYLIKYGDNQPASMVVSKDVYQKRAETNPHYDGKKSGIIVLNDNGIEYRDGTVFLANESLIGGWCEVYRKDRKYSERVEVSMDEYMGKKKDGTPNNQWATKPATMIRKVAIAQALRETFPTDLNGMFTAEEMNVSDSFEQMPAVDQQTAEREPITVSTAEAKEIVQDEM